MKKMYREVFLSSNYKIIDYNPPPEYRDLHWKFSKMWGAVHGNVDDNVCIQIVMEIDCPRFLETKAIDSTR